MLKCMFLLFTIMAMGSKALTGLDSSESFDDRLSGEELLNILSGDFPGDGDLPMNGGSQSGFPSYLEPMVTSALLSSCVQTMESAIPTRSTRSTRS